VLSGLVDTFDEFPVESKLYFVSSLSQTSPTIVDIIANVPGEETFRNIIHITTTLFSQSTCNHNHKNNLPIARCFDVPRTKYKRTGRKDVYKPTIGERDASNA
jgi:hypothetical protein